MKASHLTPLLGVVCYHRCHRSFKLLQQLFLKRSLTQSAQKHNISWYSLSWQPWQQLTLSYRWRGKYIAARSTHSTLTGDTECHAHENLYLIKFTMLTAYKGCTYLLTVNWNEIKSFWKVCVRMCACWHTHCDFTTVKEFLLKNVLTTCLIIKPFPLPCFKRDWDWNLCLNNVTIHTVRHSRWQSCGCECRIHGPAIALSMPPIESLRLWNTFFLPARRGARSLWINMAALMGPFSIPFRRGLDHLDSPPSISASPANLHQRTPTYLLHLLLLLLPPPLPPSQALG